MMMGAERIVPVLFTDPEDMNETTGDTPRPLLKRRENYLGFICIRLSGSILSPNIVSSLKESLSALALRDENDADPAHVTIESSHLSPFPNVDLKLDPTRNRFFLKGIEIGSNDEVDYAAILEPIVDLAVAVHFFIRHHGDHLTVDAHLRQGKVDPTSDKSPTVLEFRSAPVLQFYKHESPPRATRSFVRAFDENKTIIDQDPDFLREVARAKRLGLTIRKKRQGSLRVNFSYFYKSDSAYDDEIDVHVEALYLQHRASQDRQHFLKISRNIDGLIKSEIEVAEEEQQYPTAAEKLQWNWSKRKGSIEYKRLEPRLEKMMRLGLLFDMFRLVYLLCVNHLDPAKAISKRGFNYHLSIDSKSNNVDAKEPLFSFYRHYQKWIISPIESSRSLAIDSLEGIVQITEEFVEKGTLEWLQFVWENDASMAAEWNTYLLQYPYFRTASEKEVLMWRVDFTEAKLNSKRRSPPRGGATYLDVIGKGEYRCVFETFRLSEVSESYKRMHSYGTQKTTAISAFQKFWQQPEREWMKLRRYWADIVRKCMDTGLSSLMINSDLIKQNDLINAPSSEKAAVSKRVDDYIARLENIQIPWTAKDLPEKPGEKMPTAVDSAIRRIASKIRGCGTPYCKEHGSRLLLYLVLMQNVEMAKRVVMQGADVNAKTCMGRPEVASERWVFIEFPKGQEESGQPVTTYQSVADNVGGPVSSFVDAEGKQCSDPVEFEFSFSFEQVTPLAMACLLGNMQLVRFFLEKGANPMLYDAVAIRYCLPGLKEIARRWKAGVKGVKNTPEMNCFMAMFKWYRKNRNTYPITTTFKHGFFRQTLLVEALLFGEDDVINFLLVQARNQNANDMRVSVLEVIDYLLDGGLVTPRATHADVIRSIHKLLSKSKFTLDHHRMQKFCLIIESSVRNNLAGNEQAVIDVLTQCKQLRCAMGLKISAQDLEECTPVYDLLKAGNVAKTVKTRLFPRERRPTLTKVYLQVSFVQSLFEAAFQSGMYRLLQLLLETHYELSIGDVLESTVATAVATQDTPTLDILARHLTRGGEKLPDNFALMLARSWLKMLQESTNAAIFSVSLRAPTFKEKLEKLASSSEGYPKDTAPIIAHVIKLLVEHEQDELILPSATVLGWLRFAFIATRKDPELQEEGADSKNVALEEAFDYLVSKLHREECKTLLEMLQEVAALQNAFSVKRVKQFLDHCLQIDVTLMDEAFFVEFKNRIAEGALYASAAGVDEILKHMRDALKGKVPKEVLENLDSKEKESQLI